MKLVNKIVDVVLFFVFWIVFFIDISFCIKLELPKTGYGIIVFSLSVIGVSAIYICVAVLIHYLLKKKL